MFSIQQKRAIADAVQGILRSTNHPELPKGEIQFHLHVAGAEAWSWADIRNNGAVEAPSRNPWNEAQDPPVELPSPPAHGLRPSESAGGSAISQVQGMTGRPFGLAPVKKEGSPMCPICDTSMLNPDFCQDCGWTSHESSKA